MRLSSGYEERRARIEMLPLIDIVFLLLVFFIYAMLSMVVHRGLRVELPAALTAQMDRRECVSVTVTKDNVIYMDEERVSLDGLVTRVAERVRSRPEKETPVFISGDRRADLGVAMQILDRLRSAGIREVSFETREETP
jgi:biopolymer transport protein ExbD